MSQHPYETVDATSHWRKAFQDVPLDAIDIVCDFKFRIRADDKVASAGSCFAQHIARYLGKSGFNFYVPEPGHPIGSAEIKKKFHYGIFSARYGNIYTSRQLLQLFDRAFGGFSPIEDCWQNKLGHYIDPYRPTVQPNGFFSKPEMLADRRQHLKAVRKMFENLDIFVFTLGLTEYWKSAADGAAFPVCPGVAGGVFSSEKHLFHNLSTEDVIADLRAFRQRLQQVNPRAKIIFTVSPVPLMATMEKRHVLVSTVASKAILRVAADQLERECDNIAYFPSYELITSSFSRGQYFGPDLRSITESGVEHVIQLFLRHATERGEQAVTLAVRRDGAQEHDLFAQNARTIVEVICDEDLLC